MSAMPAIDEKFTGVIDMLVPLNQLSVQRRQQLFARAEVLNFRRGQYVSREGDRDGYAFYLLDGQVELYAGQQLVKAMRGGTPDAVHCLAQLQPRQLTARALSSQISILRLERDLFDKLIALEGTDHSHDVSVSEIDAEEEGDWMTRMLQSALFARVPAANIQRVFTCLEAVEFKAGDLVVRQGEPGDFYYVIQSGRAQVEREIKGGKVPVKLAELNAGDTFGEEALVADTVRNASVTMNTDGMLLCLSKQDFNQLLLAPLLQRVTGVEGERRVAAGAIWIDVRFPAEYQSDGYPGAINIPLNDIRQASAALDPARNYIVYCQTGRRSSAAAFLLSQRGLHAALLDGGMRAHAGAKEAVE